jgi:Domain of unknown function (DUF5606)
MEYSKIIAITGLPGLFELVSSKSDGGIVRSLEDKSTRFVSSRVHQFSHLESIEVYTTRHNVNLVDVLKAMENSKEKLPDDKDASGLRSYFEKVYPELDFDRVYTSDLKKMVKWFSVLVKNEVDVKLSEPIAEEAEAEPAEAEDTKPAKKTSPAKTETGTETTSAVDKKSDKKTAGSKPAEVKPAKKEAAKKAAPAKEEKKPAAKKDAVSEKPVKKDAAKKASPAKEEKKSTAKPAAKKPAPKKK